MVGRSTLYPLGCSLREPPRVRIVVASIGTDNSGAMMRNEDGAIRTSLQGSGGGADATAGKCTSGGTRTGARWNHIRFSDPPCPGGQVGVGVDPTSICLITITHFSSARKVAESSCRANPSRGKQKNRNTTGINVKTWVCLLQKTTVKPLPKV